MILSINQFVEFFFPGEKTNQIIYYNRLRKTTITPVVKNGLKYLDMSVKNFFP